MRNPSISTTTPLDHEPHKATTVNSLLPTVSENRLSILAITSELPWPLDTGGHLRSFHLLHALAKQATVRLVTSVPDGSEQAIQSVRDCGIDVVPIPCGPRRPLVEASRVLKAALKSEPYVLYRRHDHAAIREAIAGFSSTPDVLYLDHLDSLLYRNSWLKVPAVLDLHNAYSAIAGRAAQERPKGLKRAYLQNQAQLLRRVEQRAGSIADILLTVSAEEQSYFRGLGAKDVRLIPNGVDGAAYSSLPTGRDSIHRPLVVYVGAMSWEPNVRAAAFLANEVLPVLRRRHPDAALRIIGRDPASAVLALQGFPGVEVTGGVPDVRPHLADASVLAVPLESGGGTRLKILEAFAAGLPVVSTPVGCEGLDVRCGEHLMIAARDRFADALTNLIDQPARGVRLAKAARSLAHARYDWSAIGRSAWNAIRDAARTGRESRGEGCPS